MILIDAMYINDGGGKVLLDYLVRSLEQTDLNITYLFDARITGSTPLVKESNPIVFLKASLRKRHLYYKKNINLFSAVLCFGNLPPSIALPCPVYTYFHNPMYLSVPIEFTWQTRIKFALKSIVLRCIVKNSDFILVQTGYIQAQFSKKYAISHDQILLMPFYEVPYRQQHGNNKVADSFFYPSNATPHKNHIKLIEAFCHCYDQTHKGKLILTVDKSYTQVYQLIEQKRQSGYPINNIGFVGKDDLVVAYASSNYVVYPSLRESFGLGLIEGIAMGCKVVGADLPYTYAVCQPSVVFNPESVKSIHDALKTCLIGGAKSSTPVVTNQLNNLINLLNG